MTSINTTVTRISKKTLEGVREVAERQGENVTFILDDMWRIYRLVNEGIWNRKEEKDAEKKTTA
jgi:hypothetical protein